jgi:hypothetical protein
VAGGLHEQVIDQTARLVHFGAGSLTANPLGSERKVLLGRLVSFCIALATLATAAAACAHRTAPTTVTITPPLAVATTGLVSPVAVRLEPLFEIPAAIPDSVIYLDFIVGTDGRPEAGTLRLVDSQRLAHPQPGVPEFEDRVWEAVKHWQYQPGRLNGVPVRVLITQPVPRPR